jgi:hypothetical protein
MGGHLMGGFKPFKTFAVRALSAIKHSSCALAYDFSLCFPHELLMSF